MAKKKTPNDIPQTTQPSELEVRKDFQRSHYVRPASDGEGGSVGRLDLDGPIYPGWAATRDANRSSGPVRIATKSELKKYNQIQSEDGYDAAKRWLNKEWA